MTTAQLADELTNDPTNIGYSGMSTQEKLAAINLPRESISFSVIVPRSVIVEVTTPSLFRIASMPDPSKTAWLQVMENIRSLDYGLRPSDPSIQGLLAQAVAEGVLLAQEKALIDSLGVRHGSRAEQLWGEGRVVSLNDIALTL